MSGILEGDPTPMPSPSAQLEPSGSPAPSAPAAATPTPAPRSILAIGDSMLVATAPVLANALQRVEVDASIGRQVDDGIEILERRQQAGTLPQVVIVNLGVNGPLHSAQFERAMAAMRDVERVIWVTVTVPRPWEETTNDVLHKQVPRYPNAVLVDWHRVSAGHDKLFWQDGYHPRPDGAKLYAELIADAVREP